MNKPYEQLTPEEKAEICNGCGGKGGWVTPPHAVFFEASCNHHDYGYWKGGTGADRLKCDKALRAAMFRDCKALPWFKRLRFTPWCALYYAGVRLCGHRYFNYRPASIAPG